MAVAKRMKLWEVELEQSCLCFLYFRNPVCKGAKDTSDDAAGEIGELIAKQLVAGNFEAPRILSEGLMNLQANKPFKNHPGRSPSGVSKIVLFAFAFLRGEITQVSPSDVRNYLAEHGLKLSAARLSKIFAGLGLKAQLGDARTASKRKGRKG